MTGNLSRVIAVVGCQRSGTTVTGQLLGAHPSAVLIDEQDGLYEWFSVAAAGEPAAELANTMIARAAAKYRDASSRFELGDQIALLPHIECLVLKAPNLTYYDEELTRLGIDVSVVHLVRDPRAVAASMARLSDIDFVGNQCRLIESHERVRFEYPDELALLKDETASVWSRRGALWRIKSSCAPRFRAHGVDVFQLRYEDLVGDPGRVIGELVAQCGMAPSDAPLSAETHYVGTGPGETDRTRRVDARSLESWRTELSAAAERDVMAAAGALAHAFGYS